MTDTAKPKRQPLFSGQDRANLRWLWRGYLRRRAGWLALALGMILVQGLVYQQFLSMTESGLRVIFESGALRDLAMVCAAVFALFALRGAMSYLVPLITVRVSNAAVSEMRRDLIGHMMSLDLAYFERTKSGEIIHRLVTQTQQLGVFFGLATAGAVRDAVTVVIVSGYLIWKNPVLFTAAVVVLPFIIWVMNFVSDRVKQAQREAESALGDYMNGIEETVSGMRTVKIASQERMEESRLMQGTRAIRELMTRVQTTQALVMPSIDLSSAFVYVLVIGGGGYMVLSPDFDIDGAGIITFLLGMVMVFDPARLLAQFFTPDEVCVVQGDAAVASAFAALPFDHLVFTGSTAVGRKVAQAAAVNLTPTTLELGGKSPCILDADCRLEDAALKIAHGKLLNAGQTCIAPDYVLVPRDQVDAFVESFRNTTARLYPTLAANPDYTAIVSDSHHARLERYLADAQAHGATVIPVNPAGEALPGSARKLAPTLVTGVSDDMQLMQEEIFGPILPLVPYDTLDEAIAFVNARPRPLALYY
ncbi:MAG: aldehyde dehydrogenase family protein, partial [Roseovarius sp.]|nr:aldehyde dehydrogenase family protein [Roseovarius sp.]